MQTLIRNCTHAIILNLTKTLERPKGETYNLESLIDHVCHDEDKDMLKEECHKIRGNRIYSELVKYRHSIIAHRNMEYKDYRVVEQEFVECKDYLLNNKERIENLMEKINSLQMTIKRSRNKKLGLHDDGGSEVLKIEIRPEDVGKKQTLKFVYSTKH